MAVKLGELLIKRNFLTQAQLEEALQAQVIFGGKLGTVLIEMGLITEDKLAEILANLIGMPCAKPGQMQDIPEHIIKIISPELA
ncbi:MAG: general secretion pathway protein GspE, partial [Desulfuromonadales bacterium]|nr:general secretion pathway protein GspE [Desulfuromonadales bacterium]